MVCFLPFEGVAQTKEIKEWYDRAHQKPKLVYNVLEKSPEVLQGPYLFYFQNGRLQAKGQYTQDKPSGFWEYYHENGKLKMAGTLQKNIKTGLWRFYYPDGEIKNEGLYENGIKAGYWKYYYPNGQVKNEGNMAKGKNDGLWRYYYDNGQLKATCHFKNDKGYYKELYPLGSIKMQGLIRGGKSDSIWQYYHENGQLKAVGPEKNGLKNGYWKYYYPSGVLASEGRIVSGTEQGNWKYYFESGQVSSEGGHKDGHKQGAWKLYYESGSLLGEGNFDRGEGEYKEFHDNGKLKSKGRVKDGKNEGDWIYYYEDGTLEGNAEFENGEGEYTGYHPNGIIKMKGRLKDNKKTGIWELFNNEGKLAGYHKTYNEDEMQVLNPELPAKTDSVKRELLKTGRLSMVHIKRRLHYFRPKTNEKKGLILSTNPAAILLYSLPIAAEMYFNERLGYVGEFTMLRKPFFISHGSSSTENTLLSNGFSMAFKQKLYHPANQYGAFFWAQEFRFTQVNYEYDLKAPNNTNQAEDLTANEQKYEVSLLVGTRLFKQLTLDTDFTINIFTGFGIGYRKHNIPGSHHFHELDRSNITFPFRFGFMFGMLL